jgi:hypothetical protein
MTEKEVQILKEEIGRYAEEYFAMRRPGFNIESEYNSQEHGKAEFSMSTDTDQGIHFYKKGNCKILSNDSLEIYSGELSEDETSMTIVLDAAKGNIKITARNGDLILQGANVKIEATDADGDVSIKSNKTITTESPEFNVFATKSNITAYSDMLLTAGSLTLYSETGSIVAGSGQDPVLSPSLITTIFNVLDKAKKLGRTFGG